MAGSRDLVTPYEAIRAGFVAIALEKNRQATPSIEEARMLHAVARRANQPADLARLAEIRPALLTAAGVSDKAARHLTTEDKTEAIQGLIANFLEPAGPHFVDELVYRFLVVRGDALGGMMRNAVGLLARRRFTRATLAALQVAGYDYDWLHLGNRSWVSGTGADPDIEQYVGAIHWNRRSVDRILIYNVRVPLVRKNIDLSLVNSRMQVMDEALRNPNAYLALGELKGGFDPAGADEHWKTANTALSRIRGSFAGAGCHPATFFVGAAIVNSMAAEIWEQLETGQLTNAANLTDGAQLASLCSWLVAL